MKVLSLIFSLHGQKSKTAAAANRFVAELEQLSGEKADHQLITGDMMNISYCRGCAVCFNGKTCALAETDDIEKLKTLIADCDLLILGSPVYMANVSGLCKSFFDRTAAWSHGMPIPWKKTVLIATTSTSFAKETIDWLELLLTQYGCVVFSRLALADMYAEKQELTNDEKIRAAAKETTYYLQNPLLCPHERQSFQFKQRKDAYAPIASYKKAQAMAILLNHEYAQWLKNGYDNAASFDELLNRT